MNEYEQQLNVLQKAYEAEKNKREEYESAFSQQQSSRYGGGDSQDLIRWQLELDNIMERVEHLLRGDELKYDRKGNLTWQKSDDPKTRVFNEYGVQEILRILNMYLNRNTILSNYEEETINWKVYDFGIELTDLIHNKYEQMGLDNSQKIKLYPMVSNAIVDVVHSAYLRALHGGERQSLREARHVSQNINPDAMRLPSMGNDKKQFSFFKPSTWTKT